MIPSHNQEKECYMVSASKISVKFLAYFFTTILHVRQNTKSYDGLFWSLSVVTQEKYFCPMQPYSITSAILYHTRF